MASLRTNEDVDSSISRVTQSVCHRMMYRLGVVVYSRDNYCKGDPTMLESVYSFEYVCTDGRKYFLYVSL